MCACYFWLLAYKIVNKQLEIFIHICHTHTQTSNFSLNTITWILLNSWVHASHIADLTAHNSHNFQPRYYCVWILKQFSGFALRIFQVLPAGHKSWADAASSVVAFKSDQKFKRCRSTGLSQDGRAKEKWFAWGRSGLGYVGEVVRSGRMGERETFIKKTSEAPGGNRARTLLEIELWPNLCAFELPI